MTVNLNLNPRRAFPKTGKSTTSIFCCCCVYLAVVTLYVRETHQSCRIWGDGGIKESTAKCQRISARTAVASPTSTTTATPIRTDTRCWTTPATITPPAWSPLAIRRWRPKLCGAQSVRSKTCGRKTRTAHGPTEDNLNLEPIHSLTYSLTDP